MVGPTVDLRGSVRSLGTTPTVELTGWIPGHGLPLEGTARAELRHLARSREAGVRVMLDGEDVTHWLADVEGPVRLTERWDQPVRQGTVQLVGRRWLPHFTRKTWTRTPIEIYSYVGPVGDAVERLELRGYVHTCTVSDDGVALTVKDQGGLFVEADACYSVDPLHRLSVGQVCAQIATSAGVLRADFPIGDPVTKPVATRGDRALPLIHEAAESQGWNCRFLDDADATLTAEPHRLRAVVDAHWHAHDHLRPTEVVPPDPSQPTRYVFRGERAVYVDECDTETDVVTSSVAGYLLLETATHRQTGVTDPNGVPVLEPYTGPLDSEQIRVISQVRDVVTKCGDRIISESQTTWGYYNPEVARFKTGTNDAGALTEIAVPSVWVDEGGTGRAYLRARFMVVASQRRIPRYNAAGTVIGSVLRQDGFRRRLAAYRDPNQGGDVHAHGVLIGGDGESYASIGGLPRIEQYGPTAAVYQNLYYRGDGSQEREELVTWGLYSRKTTTQPTGYGYWVTRGGVGVATRLPVWQKVNFKSKTNAVDTSGHVSAETEYETGYSAPIATVGPFEWAPDQYSTAHIETLRLVSSKRKRFRKTGASRYLEIDDDGTETAHQGTPPTPRYTASSLSRMVMDSFEVELVDPVLVAWFGWRTEVVSNPWIENAETAARYVRWLQDRSLAHQLVAERPYEPVPVGSTVHLVDPDKGIDALCLVDQVEKIFGPADARCIFGLLQPLMGVR